jgi:hypothetical protein
MANLHRVIRIGEAAIIVVLAGFGLVTYRELTGLRKLPVSLPSYQFEVSGDSEATRVATTRGTWITEKGVPERLLTTTIECRKARMECTESEARVVFVSGQGLLESEQTSYEIARWTDAEIVTKPTPGKCETRQLILDLREKRAASKVSASEEKGACRERPARTLELVTGYKVRAALPQ